MEIELGKSLIDSLLNDSNDLLAVAAKAPGNVLIARQAAEKGKVDFIYITIIVNLRY